MASDRKLMITDLQGVDMIFSDPAIHTNEDFTYQILESTDHGKKGFAGFLLHQHTYCLEECKALGIPDDEDIRAALFGELDKDDGVKAKDVSSFSSEGLDKVPDDIIIICELCSGFDSMKKEDYRIHIANQHKNFDGYNYFMCTVCLIKARKPENTVARACKTCPNEFIYNKHIHQFLSQELPEHCKECL